MIIKPKTSLCPSALTLPTTTCQYDRRDLVWKTNHGNCITVIAQSPRETILRKYEPPAGWNVEQRPSLRIGEELLQDSIDLLDRKLKFSNQFTESSGCTLSSSSKFS